MFADPRRYTRSTLELKNSVRTVRPCCSYSTPSAHRLIRALVPQIDQRGARTRRQRPIDPGERSVLPRGDRSRVVEPAHERREGDGDRRERRDPPAESDEHDPADHGEPDEQGSRRHARERPMELVQPTLRSGSRRCSPARSGRPAGSRRPRRRRRPQPRASGVTSSAPVRTQYARPTRTSGVAANRYRSCRMSSPDGAAETATVERPSAIEHVSSAVPVARSPSRDERRRRPSANGKTARATTPSASS